MLFGTQSSSSAFRPLVFHFVGREESTQHSGYGLLHFLLSADWFVRKAAADALRCVAVLFGEDMIHGKKKTVRKIKERLQRQRFDRVCRSFIVAS